MAARPTGIKIKPLPKKLTDMQAAFINEYLIDLNKTKAAIRAGYTPECAAVTGCRLLRNDNVAKEINKRLKKRGDALKITADKVLTELARVAFSSPDQVAEWDSNGLTLRPSAELTPDEAATIREVEDRTTTTIRGEGLLKVEVQRRDVRVKQHDKRGALELLGRHLGLFKPEGGFDPNDKSATEPLDLNYKK